MSRVATHLRDQVREHTNKAGERPSSVSLSPLVFDLLDEEFEDMARIDVGDTNLSQGEMYVDGIHVEKDDDLQAVVIDG